MAKIKLLFVCLGNICRSPLAQAIMLDYVNKNGLAHKFEIDSVGTCSYHVGKHPDPRAVAALNSNGLNINHVARQIQFGDIEYYDYILVMDHRNYEDVTSLTTNKELLKKVFLLRSFDEMSVNNYNVPDPFYGLDDAFDEVISICGRSINGFMQFLEKQ